MGCRCIALLFHLHPRFQEMWLCREEICKRIWQCILYLIDLKCDIYSVKRNLHTIPSWYGPHAKRYIIVVFSICPEMLVSEMRHCRMVQGIRGSNHGCLTGTVGIESSLCSLQGSWHCATLYFDMHIP